MGVVMINPEYFDWGRRIQEGMQQSQENRRSNALLDMTKQRFGWEQQDRQVAAQQKEKQIQAWGDLFEENKLPRELAYTEGADELALELLKQKSPQTRKSRVGLVNPGDYTPESVQRWIDTGDYSVLQRIWAPINPLVKDIGGVPTQIPVVPRGAGGYSSGGGNVPTMAPYEPAGEIRPPAGMPPRSGTRPLSSLENEAAAAQRLKEAEGFGSVTGQETARRQEAINTKIQNISNMDELLDLAGPLIQASTGSLVGAGVDKLTNAFGVSLSGDQAIGALQPIAAALLANVPRMEGPQSDADRLQYERAAGDVANPALPREKRLAAVRQIRQINAKYRALNRDTRKGQKRVVRTGTHNGRKVVEYSDGTIEYAD